MKKLFLPFFFLLLVSGCSEPVEDSVRSADMEKGYIHFAANIVLEDTIRRGDDSPFAFMAPALLANPDNVIDAGTVIEGFRANSVAEDDRYYKMRATGIVVGGTVSRFNHDALEVVFSREETTGRSPFSGMLRISLDTDYYSASNRPDIKEGSSQVFVCREYRPVHDFRDGNVHRVEVRMIQCMTENDYFNYFQGKVKERMVSVFSGREEVHPDAAKYLAALYMTGGSIPAGSVCLDGGFLDCRKVMLSEFVRKWEDVDAKKTGEMKLNPDRVMARRSERFNSEPAIRPADASPVLDMPGNPVEFRKDIDPDAKPQGK